jgi:diaminohydroxyphosphoribosylaminopyrimidine deaminase/5-amino-6-(5-phosphoribosylamino)uracil reductase
MQDPNPLVAGRGLARLREAGIAVDCGLMEAAARQLNRGFVSRMTRGRPFVTLKLAASLDGRTAMASGESCWITSEAARADVHRLRAEAGAVLTSVDTVLADDPQLTVRVPLPPPSAGEGWGEGEVHNAPVPRQPDRIVLDSWARVPARARVWDGGARRFWLTGAAPATVPEGVEPLAVETGANGRLDLNAALAALGRAGVNEVLVECGPRLAGALLQARLVDELVAYLAPSLLGDTARPLAVLGLERLDQRLNFRFAEVRPIGPDLRITAVPQES